MTMDREIELAHEAVRAWLDRNPRAKQQVGSVEQRHIDTLIRVVLKSALTER